MIKFLVSLVACFSFGGVTYLIISGGQELTSSSFWWLMLTLFFAGWGITDIIDTLLPESKGR